MLCTICSSTDRHAIDVALVSGTPNRRIASQYGLTEAAVRRHRAAHLPAQMARARDAAELADADDLAAQVRALQARALAILDDADAAGDRRSALSAIREARGALELVARITGALREHVELHPAEERPQFVACWGDGTPCSPAPNNTVTTRTGA
jgi:hypothetical protein